MKKTYAEFADREIRTVKEFYKSKAENSQGEEPEESKLIVEGVEWVEEKKTEKLEYANILADKEYNEEEPTAIGPQLGDDIYPITHDDWYMEEVEYEHVCLTWFQEDNALCDDDDRLVEDVTGTVGDLFHEWFGQDPSSEEGTIFVRNTKLMIDFEITRDEGSYLDAIGSH